MNRDLPAPPPPMLATREEVDTLRAENKELRESLILACELRTASHEHERQLWAMRRAANLLSQPFSHDRVQDEYDAWPSIMEALTVAQDLLALVEQRIATIANESFGPFPVQSVDESLTAIERGIFEQRVRIERMRPVVEAAKVWHAAECTDPQYPSDESCQECGYPACALVTMRQRLSATIDTLLEKEASRG